MTRAWTLLSAVLCLLVVPAQANPPALEPHEVGTVTISTPKGWAFTGDASKGMALARQDPARKDAAQLLVLVNTSGINEDQALDTLTGQVAQGLKVVKRGAGPRGMGKLVVGDGTTDGLKVRLGAVAIGADGTVVIGMLVAKSGDFDALGGTDLVVSVMASMKDAGTATAPAPGTDAVMQPQRDSSGRLIIPAPSRAITVADLAGGWKRNDSATSGSGNGSAVALNETWTIGAKGDFKEKVKGAIVIGGNAQPIDQTNTGRVFIDRDGTLVIERDKKPTQHYIIRGWFYGQDQTIMRLNGPYNGPISPQDLAHPGSYMDHLYVRAR